MVSLRVMSLGTIASQFIVLIGYSASFVFALLPNGIGRSIDSPTAHYDLQSMHHERSPADVLNSLVEACDTLGVNTFDFYGDFSSGKIY